MVDRDNGPLNYTEMQRAYASKRFREIAELIPEYDMVALLDKSARPLFLGFHDLIQRKGYAQPQWRFMNFGSNKTQRVFRNGGSHLNFFFSPLNKDKVEDILTKENVASFITTSEINYLISLLQLDQPFKRLFIDEISISSATHYTLLRLLDLIGYRGENHFVPFIEPKRMNLFGRGGIPSLTQQCSLVYGSDDRSNPYKIIPSEGYMRREGYAIRRALRDIALSGNL